MWISEFKPLTWEVLNKMWVVVVVGGGGKCEHNLYEINRFLQYQPMGNKWSLI